MPPWMRRNNNGWETGNPLEIFQRYGQSGTPATYGGFPITGLPNQGYGPSSFSPQPAAGAAGPTGPTGPASAASVGGFGNSDVWGGENAMQRSQTEAESQNAAAATSQNAGQDMRGISPQRRYFWATGLVDARATQSPANTADRAMPVDWERIFGSNRQHMGKRGTTWEERQASNNRGIANARELRGLAPY